MTITHSRHAHNHALPPSVHAERPVTVRDLWQLYDAIAQEHRRHERHVGPYGDGRSDWCNYTYARAVQAHQRRRR